MRTSSWQVVGKDSLNPERSCSGVSVSVSYDANHLAITMIDVADTLFETAAPSAGTDKSFWEQEVNCHHCRAPCHPSSEGADVWEAWGAPAYFQ